MAQPRNHDSNSNQSKRRVTFYKAERAVDLTLRFGREGESHTAKCVELGTSMFGDSPAEAEEAILEAIALQLDALDEHGELEPFLVENSVKIHKFEPAWSFARESVPA